MIGTWDCRSADWQDDLYDVKSGSTLSQSDDIESLWEPTRPILLRASLQSVCNEYQSGIINQILLHSLRNKNSSVFKAVFYVILVQPCLVNC